MGSKTAAPDFPSLFRLQHRETSKLHRRGDEAGVGRTGVFYAGNGYGVTGIGYTELGEISSTDQQ